VSSQPLLLEQVRYDPFDWLAEKGLRLLSEYLSFVKAKARLYWSRMTVCKDPEEETHSCTCLLKDLCMYG